MLSLIHKITLQEVSAVPVSQMAKAILKAYKTSEWQNQDLKPGV